MQQQVIHRLYVLAEKAHPFLRNQPMLDALITTAFALSSDILSAVRAISASALERPGPQGIPGSPADAVIPGSALAGIIWRTSQQPETSLLYVRF
jgi:hypothetical protein